MMCARSMRGNASRHGVKGRTFVRLLSFALAASAMAGVAKGASDVSEVRGVLQDMIVEIDGLWVKFDVTSKIEPGGEGSEDVIGAFFSATMLDEYARSGDKRFRRIKSWQLKDTGQKAWEEEHYVFNGIKRWSLRWECVPPKSPTVLEAHVFGDRSIDYFEKSCIYIEAIGSLDYDGAYLDTRKVRLLTNRAVDANDLPVAVVPALTSGKYVRRSATEAVEGHDCVVIEFAGYDVIWLDPQRSFALVKRELRWEPGGDIMTAWTNTGFREVKPSVWLPGRVTRRIFLPDGTTVTNECRVTDVSIGAVPDSLFEITFPAGTRALDMSTRLVDSDGGAIAVPYTVGETPEESQAALDKAIQEFESRGQTTYGVVWLRILGLCVSAVLTIWISVLLWSRRRKRGS